MPSPQSQCNVYRAESIFLHHKLTQATGAEKTPPNKGALWEEGANNTNTRLIKCLRDDIGRQGKWKCTAASPLDPRDATICNWWCNIMMIVHHPMFMIRLYVLGEAGAVHAVPAVWRPLQPHPGAGARGRPARHFVLMAET